MNIFSTSLKWKEYRKLLRRKFFCPTLNHLLFAGYGRPGRPEPHHQAVPVHWLARAGDDDDNDDDDNDDDDEQGVPKSGEGFIDFIGQVHKTKEQFGQEGPISVHCRWTHFLVLLAGKIFITRSKIFHNICVGGRLPGVVAVDIEYFSAEAKYAENIWFCSNPRRGLHRYTLSSVGKVCGALFKYLSEPSLRPNTLRSELGIFCWYLE